MSIVKPIAKFSDRTLAAENLDVRTTAQRFGISHVLEGSIRRAGDEVRVTVQLINARTAVIWLEPLAMVVSRGIDPFRITVIYLPKIGKTLRWQLS